MDKKQSVIFLHISKTGGTTLRSIIGRQYTPTTIYDLDPSYFVSESSLYEATLMERVAGLKAMSDTQKAQFRCFFHPAAYGLHEILPQSASYFTFLRDPIDHFISSFYFAVNNPSHIHHDLIKTENMTIEAFANRLRPDNLQTRRLSGCDPIDKLSGLPALPADALEKAKSHLSQMPIFGLMEQYDESMLLIQEKFFWRDISYKAQNVAPKRMRLEETSSELREKLESILVLDIELYHFAQERFQAHLKASQLHMETALIQFRKQNQALAQADARKKKLRALLKFPFRQK